MEICREGAPARFGLENPPRLASYIRRPASVLTSKVFPFSGRGHTLQRWPLEIASAGPAPLRARCAGEYHRCLSKALPQNRYIRVRHTSSLTHRDPPGVYWPRGCRPRSWESISAILPVGKPGVRPGRNSETERLPAEIAGPR